MAERGDSHNTDRHEEPAAVDIDVLVADYIDRLIAGEKLNRDELAARHPEVAEQILSELDAFVELNAEVEPPFLGTLGDYTLRRQIGRGGMGVVYEAWQESLDRQVALKVLPVGVAADTRASSRFLREAQVAAKLSHPQVVSVYGFGVEQNTPYYAMLTGQSPRRFRLL